MKILICVSPKTKHFSNFNELKTPGNVKRNPSQSPTMSLRSKTHPNIRKPCPCFTFAKELVVDKNCFAFFFSLQQWRILLSKHACVAVSLTSKKTCDSQLNSWEHIVSTQWKFIEADDTVTMKYSNRWRKNNHKIQNEKHHNKNQGMYYCLMLLWNPTVPSEV